MLVTSGADNCTLRATVSAVADIFYTISADIAGIAPASVTDTILTISAIRTQVTGAICTLLSTPGTYISTFGATIAAIANIFNTVYTHFTAVAKIALTTNAISTYATASTNAFWLTINTFFVTFGTHACTLVTALTTIANYCTIATHIAVGTPSVITDAINAIPTGRTEITCTILTLFITSGTDICTIIATLTTIANYCTCTTGATITTPYSICFCAIRTNLATLTAQRNGFTISTGLSTSIAEGSTIGAALTTDTNFSTGTAGVAIVTEFIVTYTVRTFITFFTYPICTFVTIGTTANTNILTIFAAGITALAD